MAEKATRPGPMGENQIVYSELTPLQHQAAINHMHADIPGQYSYEYDRDDPTWIVLNDVSPELVQSFEAALVV
ncbi:MAG: hypothetical protein ABW022_11225 [Actinoplanes sp.]